MRIRRVESLYWLNSHICWYSTICKNLFCPGSYVCKRSRTFQPSQHVVNAWTVSLSLTPSSLDNESLTLNQTEVLDTPSSYYKLDSRLITWGQFWKDKHSGLVPIKLRVLKRRLQFWGSGLGWHKHLACLLAANAFMHSMLIRILRMLDMLL